MPRDEFDCTRCGACCTASFDDDRYVELGERDYKRLSSPQRNLIVITEPVRCQTGRWLRTKINSDGDQVCACLSGTVGIEVSCSIYETRPDVCRGFKVGGRYCKEARAEVARLLGLEAGDL